MIEDAAIIADVLRGNREAFALLVRRYSGKILGLCMTLVHDRAEAEDAAQEAFLKAYKSLKDFRGEAAFLTWIYRIAYNHCLTLRSQSARRKSQLEKVKEDTHVASLPLAGDSLVEKTESALAILEVLPNDYRQVIVLRLDGFHYQEIAEMMGVSVDAVKAKLRRARRSVVEKIDLSQRNSRNAQGRLPVDSLGPTRQEGDS